MESKNEILSELREIAPYLGEAGALAVPYLAPAHYFDDFADILKYRIRFEVEGFSELNNITSPQEIAEISPMLAGLRNKSPYQVPNGYFQQLSTSLHIPEKTSSNLTTIQRSKRMSKRSIPMTIIRYAAAACIVGMIGVATFNLTRHHISDPIKGLTTVSNQDMANYLDIDDVHWTPDNSSSFETSTVHLTDADIHDLFGSVPDVELEQYSALLPEQKPSVN